jgi:hypothetical protein
VKVPDATPATPGVQAPVRVAPRSHGKSPNRLLLLAVAAVCLLALAMRRKSKPVYRDDVPPATDAESGSYEADVIPMHRAS